MIFSPISIAEPKIESKEERLYSIWWLKWFDNEVIQSVPHILIYPRFSLLAKWLSQLKVVCWPRWMPWIQLFWVLARLVVRSCCLPICFPPCIFHSNYMRMSPHLVGSGVHVRSGFWGSIGSWSGVSSGGGGAWGTLSMGRWISWLSASMAIQVHRLKSNRDGWVRAQPAGGSIPSGNRPSFIDIGWYCW